MLYDFVAFKNCLDKMERFIGTVLETESDLGAHDADPMELADVVVCRAIEY